MRSIKRGARVYTCVGPYERHEAWTQKGGDGRCVCTYVVGRRWRGLSIDVCGKELWRLWQNDLKKKMTYKDQGSYVYNGRLVGVCPFVRVK